MPRTKTLSAMTDHILNLIEKACFCQQGYGDKKREQKIVLGILVAGFTQAQAADFWDLGNSQKSNDKAGKRS
jgi:hypothetical protein